MSSTPTYWTPTGGPSVPVRPSRFAGPAWRIPGAIAAWLMFTFCFTLLYQASGVLSGLGGFCASGGPYVIETPCPDTVVWAFPVGFIGVVLSWGIGLYLQRGFSAPVIVWGWPILFVGLGIQFFFMIALGAVLVGILCGTLFVLMGLAPLVFELRAGPRRVILGKTNVRDVRFTDKPGAPRTFYAFGRDDAAVTAVPTPGDWLLSLLVSSGSIAAGVALGLLVMS
ncbi:MAG: hypothetical protein JWP32_1975 [Schumannella sp.]|nr:hypothetical protein [Schumannella sp.]